MQDSKPQDHDAFDRERAAKADAELEANLREEERASERLGIPAKRDRDHT